MKALYIVLIAVLLASCGPSAEQITATAEMAQAQTETAAPTLTPTATATLTSTPTLIPTATPSPTLTPSPTPSIPKIMGKIQLNIVPLDDKTIIPKPPFELAILISPASGDEEIRIQSNDDDGNFVAYLNPGKYEIKSIVIKDESLGEKEYELGTDQKSFTVSSEPCAYVGTLTFTLIRLPPGSFGEQIEAVQKVAKGAPILFSYLETGGFLMPVLTEIASAGECPELPQASEGFNWKYLPESALAVLAPNDWNYKREQNDTTKAYYISLEDIDKEGSFKTGMTIQVIRDKSKNASKTAKGLHATITSQSIVTKSSEVSERTDGGLIFYEFEYEASFQTYNATVHNLMVANKATNTLYMITFESPTDQWDEAWKIGQVMIEQIQFFGGK